MSSVRCPLCSAVVDWSGLETHVRVDLGYTSLRCLLCPLQFFALPDAQAHFRGPTARHPNDAVAIAELSQPHKHQRLLRALQDARAAQPQLPCHACGRGPEAQTGLPTAGDLKPLHVQPPADASPEQRSEAGAEAESPPEPMAEAPPQPSPQPLALSAVKAEPTEALAESKAGLLATDGKVACLQCGSRQGPDHFADHSLVHAPAAPFNCNACPFDSHSRRALKEHVKKEHDLRLTSDAFTFTLSAGAKEALVEACFGEAKTARRAKALCGPCDKEVDRTKAKDHVARAHLRQPIHRCLRCPFVSHDFTAGQIKAHLAKVHREPPSPDAWANDSSNFAPAIKNMIPKLFGL